MSRRSRDQQGLPIESSWRMVEGEQDSFDTTVIPHEDTMGDDLQLSSGPSQFSGSDPSQGNFSIGGSQDRSTVQDFLSKADEERVILRSPFQPSVPGVAKSGSSGVSRTNGNNRSPEPEFYMPRVDVEMSRRGATTRAGRQDAREGNVPGLRRRPVGGMQQAGRSGYGKGVDAEIPGPAERLMMALPTALFDVLAWALGIVGLACKYAQKPLAIALAVYFTFGGLIIAQNMATKSIYASLSPVCRIPGVSMLNLPFCPQMPTGKPGERGKMPVEFDGLMDVQDKFEEVLEKSANGVSLPMEMKRSETSVRDLRTMVRYSDLQGKEELVLEFDGFIDAARTASADLQKFNTHVGSAVDSVISINRWTSRYLDGLVAEHHESQGRLAGAIAKVFAPFQPAVFNEQNLLDKYVEHTALVSGKISDLILEAQSVLRTLSKAEDHLGIIYDFVARTQKSVQSRKDEILWTLWTIVGKNSKTLHNLNGQLSLLKQTDAQRIDAVKQVTELVLELEKIQAGLDDLRDRVAEPEMARAAGHKYMPLSVHIETIDRGVERLEDARTRIRAMENERIREVLDRGKNPERLIES